ncbi:MAG: DUF4340 domain-containing protein [Bdellovibrionaceae bacterium]|nr:DUF4340 domain-containing protein [Bdellovibrio sp.]
MKFKTTALLGIATVGIGLGVYFLEYKNKLNLELEKENSSQIITFSGDQVNFIELQKKKQKITLQKSEKGWTLLEPIQDQADNDKVEELINGLIKEKSIAVAKAGTQLSETDLKDYGLDDPEVVYIFKNNSGSSHKVTVGSQKNFEGNAFIRLDSENRVLVANTAWYTQGQNALIYYREKRLFRYQLAAVNEMKVKSLQDQFSIKKVDGKWIVDSSDFDLDQNKVHDMLKKIAEASILEYVIDGEPSTALLKEKGLIKSPVRVQLNRGDLIWSAEINQNEKEKSLFAITDRPTNLVRLNITDWEFFGNLTLDSLRDRSNLTRFNIDDVKKIYYKTNNKSLSFEKEGDHWKPSVALTGSQSFDEKTLQAALNRIHDLVISEFINKGANEFRGTDMVILKAGSDRLVYQLNWGPELKLKRHGAEKNYYYARTQLDPLIFALEKSKIESLGFDKIITSAQNAVHAKNLISSDDTQSEKSQEVKQ